ncbi:hypothetical protein BRD00_04070 [Halobacteriales archaeon QS_8_69_26]|nr:MAG: hypothetical protein BRD00_04070 [Halobacteriales archaeon QS_8_69_26]
MTAGSGVLAGCAALSGDDGNAGTTAGSTTSTGETDGSPTTTEGTPDGSIWSDADDLPVFGESTVVEFGTAPVTAVVDPGLQPVDYAIRRKDGVRVDVGFEVGATRESPATVLAAVANPESGDRTGDVLVLDAPVTGRTDGGDRVFLVPTERHPFAETVPEHGRDGNGRWRLREVEVDPFPDRITLPAGRGFVGEYYLLAPPGDAPPVGPGRYLFGPEEAGPRPTLRWFAVDAWPTGRPGPEETSRFDDADPPGIDRRTRWFHDATPETTVYLRPGEERVAPPAMMGFDLVNRSRRSFDGNPEDWGLYKLVDGDPFRIAPWRTPLPLRTLHPGGRLATRLSVFHGEATDAEGRTVGRLGGGRYAYEVDFSADARHAALFEVDAPTLTVDLEPDATIVEEGETVVVELPNHEGGTGQATLVVEFAPDAVPDRRVVPEQLPRDPFHGVRNALPAFDDGVRTVRVRTDLTTAERAPGYGDRDSPPIVVGYEGEGFRLTIEREDG